MTVAEREVLDYSHLQVRIVPETPQLGAVVEGVNCKEPQSDEVVKILTEALLRYKVLFFRAQHLSPPQQQAFALNFGPPSPNPLRFLRPYDEEGLSDVTVVPHFHADMMYLTEGPSFSLLQMLELPPVGGDTMWADLVASYADLSQPMKDFLEPLVAINGRKTYFMGDDDLRKSHKRQYGEELDAEQLRKLREYLAPCENPVVRVIPETGAKNYWVSEEHTLSIKGLSKQESDAILTMLFRHQLQPRYVYRWRWGVGDLALWDQRTTLHSGIADYGDQKRFAQRQSVGTNRPVPAFG